jgi:hypothetical protein
MKYCIVFNYSIQWQIIKDISIYEFLTQNISSVETQFILSQLLLSPFGFL